MEWLTVQLAPGKVSNLWRGLDLPGFSRAEDESVRQSTGTQPECLRWRERRMVGCGTPQRASWWRGYLSWQGWGSPAENAVTGRTRGTKWNDSFLSVPDLLLLGDGAGMMLGCWPGNTSGPKAPPPALRVEPHWPRRQTALRVFFYLPCPLS